MSLTQRYVRHPATLYISKQNHSKANLTDKRCLYTDRSNKDRKVEGEGEIVHVSSNRSCKKYSSDYYRIDTSSIVMVLGESSASSAGGGTRGWAVVSIYLDATKLNRFLSKITPTHTYIL